MVFFPIPLISNVFSNLVVFIHEQDFTEMVQLVAKELILIISVVPRLREQRGATLGFLKEKSSSSASAGKDKTTSSSSSHSRGKNSQAKVPASGSSTPSSRSVGKSTPQTISTPSSTNSLPSFFEVKKQPIHACFFYFDSSWTILLNHGLLFFQNHNFCTQS